MGRPDGKKFREDSKRFSLCCFVIIVHTAGFGFRYDNSKEK